VGSSVALRISALFCLSLPLIVLSGCLYTVNPAYYPSDIVFLSELIGEWQDQANPDHEWIFRPAEDKEKAYDFIYKMEGEQQFIISARLFKLEDDLFLDFFPEEEVKASKSGLVVPLHMIAKVNIVREDYFELVYLNSDWAGENTKIFENQITHVEGSIDILSSRGDENRMLLIKYAQKAFSLQEDGKNIIKFGRISTE